MKLEELIDSREDRDAILQHCRVTGDDRAEIRDTGDTVIFPVENETLTDRLLTGFGKNGKAYDYTAYDRALDSAWISPRRAGLMMMRLRYPTDLTPEKQAELRQKISENLHIGQCLMDFPHMRTDIPQIRFIHDHDTLRSRTV